MDQREIDLLPSRGAKFYRMGNDVRFVLVVDASTIIGPRAATDQDRKNHPAAWHDFAASPQAFNGADPEAFNHDGVDGAGGSVPGRKAMMTALREKGVKFRATTPTAELADLLRAAS